MTVGWLLAAGCGPSVASSSAGGSSATSETGAVNPSGSTSGTSGTGSTQVGTSSGSSSATGDSLPEVVEVEGWLSYTGPEPINPATYFVACSGEYGGCLRGNVHELRHCNGTFARLRGYQVSIPQGLFDDPCGGTAFHVTEVLESRVCESGDCDCAEGLDCQNTCWSPDSCPDGFKCAPWTNPAGADVQWACAEVSIRAGEPGSPCHNDPQTPWIDDCDASSTCVAGQCQTVCSTDEDCAGQRCFGWGEGGLCLQPCNPLSPECPAGLECRQKARGFACVDADLEPFAGPDACGQTFCTAEEVCVSEQPPEGWTQFLCTDLCDVQGDVRGDVRSPSCPPGLTCAAVWTDDQPGLENVGACE